MKKEKLKTIALIAHDGKKEEMTHFAKIHHKKLEKFKILATYTTGTRLEKVGTKLTKLLSGPQGGDAQIAALVASQKCHAVIFFRDPLGMHPHEPDISMLLRICEVHNVPLALNPSSAELIIKGL